MSTEIIIALIGVIATGCSSFFTWLFARKKYNAEVDHQVVENMQRSLDFYIKLSEDTIKRLDDYHKDNMELRQENEELRKKIDELQAQVSHLKRNICYKESCREREDTEPPQQKTSKRNGTKGNKKVEER